MADLQFPAKFAEKEKVLVFHGPLMYEAKILKVKFEEEKNEWTYYVHYNGWNKKWDHFAEEKRILKHNEANLKRQAEVQAAYDEEMKAVKAKAGSKSKKKSLASDKTDSRPSTPASLDQKPTLDESGNASIASVEQKAKRKKNDCVETESHFNKKLEINIPIPDELKLFLVDDWDSVTRLNKLVKLPARITIEKLFAEYLNEKSNDPSASQLCAGLRKYFNLMIGSQLLYTFEKIQYEQFKSRNPSTPMTEVYGCVHLLRLFTRLGSCLVYTNLDPVGMDILLKEIEKFLPFLLANYDLYFTLEDYGEFHPETKQESPTENEASNPSKKLKLQ